jgi:hypothetical protein
MIWFAATMSAYGVILAVQEIDFVRSIFYQHAIFWGLIFGQAQPQCEGTTAYRPTQHVPKFNLLWFRKAFFITVLLGSLTLLITSIFSFSLVGYQYEANARNGYNPKVRWFGSFGTLNYVLPRADQKSPVARFRVLKSFATEYSILSKQGWKRVSIVNPGLGASFIDIPVSSGFQLPNVVKFNSAQNDYGRHISVLVAWPPEIIEGQK